MTLTTMAVQASPVLNVIGSILLIIVTAGIIILGVKFYDPLMELIKKWSLIKLFNDLLAETKDPEYQKAIADLQGFYLEYKSGKITLEQLKQKILNDGQILYVLMVFVSILATWSRQFKKG